MPRVRAPGRVNLIGDHTDYNQGFCLPMAIDRLCSLTWEPRADGRVVAASRERAGRVDIAADGSDDPGAVEPEWGRFVAGAVRAVAERARRSVGLDLCISSEVPVGSGLSSSSALTVALVLAIGAARGMDLADRREVAQTALAAEILATGVPGGLMDQLCCLFGVAGHALLLDCRDLSVTPVPLPPDLGVLVVHSGRPRALAGSAYAERRAACEATAASLGVAALRDATPEQVRDDPLARHVVSEDARVLTFVDALRAGRIGALGALLLESHASLRDDYRVSTPELDVLVGELVDAGALGARLTGAGFGGCVVALVEATTASGVAGRATERYAARTGAAAQAFLVRAAAGATNEPDARR